MLWVSGEYRTPPREDEEVIMVTRSRTLIKSKDVLSREELADLLRSIADRLRDDTLTLSRGADSVALEVPASLHVDLELKDDDKRSGTKRELEIEMWWQVDETGRPTGEATPSGGLNVS